MRQAESLPYKLSPLRHALVLPLGDRTLDDVWTHEFRDRIIVNKVLRESEIFLREVHNRNIMHGDIHPSNLLRIDDLFHLTSVSASYQIPTDHLSGMSHESELTHISLYPPEMFIKFHSEVRIIKYRKYYQTIIDDPITHEKHLFTSERN